MEPLNISMTESIQIKFFISPKCIRFESKELGDIARRDVGEIHGEIAFDYVDFNMSASTNILGFSVGKYNVHLHHVGFVGNPNPHIDKVKRFITETLINFLFKSDCVIMTSVLKFK